MDNGITFLPNDRYLLENGKFRLYYTAQGDEAHNFIVVIEDNFKIPTNWNLTSTTQTAPMMRKKRLLAPCLPVTIILL